ncbi:MAG: hypothetical protein GY791_02090 [Alphaproteobacteria bacterium]|nr:hypothetical protein [Alphaproteobacteria bacterium]
MNISRTVAALAVAAGLGLGWVPGASAEIVVTYVLDGRPYFTLAAPDNWVVDTGFETEAEEGVPEPPMPRIVSLFPEADRVLWFGAWQARRVKSFDEAIARFADLGAFVMDETNVDETRDTTINGMTARIVRGTGRREEQDVAFGIVLFEIAPETIGAALYLGEPAAWEVYGEAITGIVRSLRPVAQGGAAQ